MFDELRERLLRLWRDPTMERKIRLSKGLCVSNEDFPCLGQSMMRNKGGCREKMMTHLHFSILALGQPKSSLNRMGCVSSSLHGLLVLCMWTPHVAIMQLPVYAACFTHRQPQQASKFKLLFYFRQNIDLFPALRVAMDLSDEKLALK